MNLFLAGSLPEYRRRSLWTGFLFTLIILCGFPLSAQNVQTIKGVVLDGKNEPVIGATIRLKNDNSLGTITDFDGEFTFTIPEGRQVIVVTYIGMEAKELVVDSGSRIVVILEDDTLQLDDVVIVGYGQQKKASVVGAITQTTGEVLQRAGGVSNIGAALTGNLPGVVTTTDNGMPGEEEPQIVIRGSSSWNNSDPLVLVDGIERPMSSVDISSVQTISVLKDASATAVYGVKGANGVILITTKRGSEGRAQIDISVNMTIKAPSMLPNKLDSYDALRARNRAIENELTISPGSWDYMTPQDIIDKYRYPVNLAESERYPNVDWQKAIFKDFTTSYNANINVSGGTRFVKYFVAADYLHEGDIFEVWDNNRGYNSGYGYNRINVRSNLDFQLTRTTTFKVNLAGSNGVKQSPWSNAESSDWAIAQQWSGVYNIAPDVFLPKYSDGTWGYYPNISNVTNSAAQLALAGHMNTTTTRINTDFVLEQDLSFITKGLTARGLVSWDNVYVEHKRGVNDTNNSAQYKWINPDTGEEVYRNDYENNSLFDYKPGSLWSIESGEIRNELTERNLNYQLQLNWARTFDKHSVSAMGLFGRQENAKGSQIPNYREDWVFRVTYDYGGKYFAEYNGAYNGSEKFSKENRFAFFNSGAIGWMISEENFMKNIKFLDMLKIRASYGEIGDDSVDVRWLYMTQWAYGMNNDNGGHTAMDLNQGLSPYTWYREASVGNPNVHWETVKKLNIGADYSFLGGMFAGTVEVFRDKRVDILVKGSDRSVPSYFGATPATANLGEVKTKGYELELRFNKVINNSWRVWSNFSMTHAKNEILIKDDPDLLPAYQKSAGYAIDQYRSHISSGYLGNYDQIYGSPQHDTNDANRLPGDYYIVDFNGDGTVDSKDSAPYGYSKTPQNTYNATIGFEWKGLSAFVQFYGVNNVTRDVTLTSFGSMLNNVYDNGTWWSKYNTDADVIVPRWASLTSSYSSGTQYLYDGSYIRLKNAEVAYTFNSAWVRKLGLNTLKVFINGNNLWVWSRMPDDRESNFSGASYMGAYPTMRRYNMGLKITL